MSTFLPFFFIGDLLLNNKLVYSKLLHLDSELRNDAQYYVFVGQRRAEYQQNESHGKTLPFSHLYFLSVFGIWYLYFQNVFVFVYSIGICIMVNLRIRLMESLEKSLHFQTGHSQSQLHQQRQPSSFPKAGNFKIPKQFIPWNNM